MLVSRDALMKYFKVSRRTLSGPSEEFQTKYVQKVFNQWLLLPKIITNDQFSG